MKLDKRVTAGVAAVLAFCISLGAAGCMVSGFELTLKSYPALVLTCAASALFCATAFSWKRGGILVLCALALAAGWLWRQGETAEQFWQLLYRISYLYNKAYHWGYFQLVNTPWNAGFADLPMGILGALLAMVVSWTVCRGKSSVWTIILALLPLFSCLVITDTVPSEGYLFALIFGLILLLLTSRVRKSNPLQGNRLTFLAAVPTVLALGILFLAVPREGYVNHSAEMRDNILTWFRELPDQFETTVTESPINIHIREPERVNLSSLGPRIESTLPVMDVTAEVGGTLYLRGQDYDVYDGTGWQASPNRVEDLSYQGADLGYVSIQTRSKLGQLYLPYYPRDAASLIGGKVENTRLDTAYAFRRTGFAESLTALLESVPRTEPREPLARYLELPDNTRSGAEALLRSIADESATVTGKAEEIAKFVRSSAIYEKNTSRMPSSEEDFALWFLEDSDTGYCVHFATAAVVLLRAADIEARYVSGYMVRARAGETVTVTGENAHAWAEYYEPLLGTWLVLEATPADSEEAVPVGTVSPMIPEETDPTPATQSPTQPTEIPTHPSFEAATPTEPAAPAPQRDLSWLADLMKTLLTLAAAAVLIEGQRKIRLGLRRHHQRTGTPNDQALARWREAVLLAKLLKEPAPQELDFLAQKAKFSQHTLSAEELTAFEGYLRTARKRLRQKAWYWQLVHQYIFAVY